MIRVLHYVAIMDRGGEETFIMNVFKAIDRTKVCFDFLCTLPEDGAYADEIKALGGRIFHSDFNRRHDRLKTLDNAFVLRKFLKEHKNEYRAFHIHTQHAMDGMLSSWAAKSAGIGKVIVHSHSINTLDHRTAHKICRPFLARMKVKRYACSNTAGKWLFGNGKFEVLPSGVNSKLYLFNDETRTTVRKENDWDGKRVIGHVGNFTHPKNQLFMVEIMNHLSMMDSSALLVFAGRGETMQKCKDLAKEMNIENRIRFLGSRNDVHNLYQGMDLFLFPSKFEGLGMALIEAQISGLKCICSDVIPKEAIISNNVLIKGLSDPPESWAKAIAETNTYKRKDMTKEVSETGIDINAISERLLGFYTS